jgi:hypothetical protein
MAKKSSMKNRKLRGGAGGAEHAVAVYGGPGQQASVSAVGGGNENNVIAMNSPAGRLSGGRRRKKGGNITDLAVPAVLLVANHIYKRKGASTMRYRGSRRSRRNFSRKVRGGNK